MAQRAASCVSGENGGRWEAARGLFRTEPFRFTLGELLGVREEFIAGDPCKCEAELRRLSESGKRSYWSREAMARWRASSSGMLWIGK